jgi:iron complex outermembrane recepter protein
MKQCYLLPILAVGLVATHLSFAQEANESLTTEDVIVTATRFEEKTGDHVTGVTVITRSQIEFSNARTVVDVLTSLGGVHARDNSGQANPQLDMRGFGIGGDQNTLVLVNGQRISENELLPANIAALPLTSIERIEILRSGGAVLYGGGTTGGTINIITRNQTASTRSGQVLFGAGSYDGNVAEAAFGLAGQTLSLDLAVRRTETDNYRRNNALRQDTVNASAHYAAGRDIVSLNIGTDSQSIRLPGALSAAQIAADPRATQDPEDHTSLDSGFASLAWSRSLEGLELSADGGYREKDAVGQVSGGQNVVTGRTLLFSPRAKITGRVLGARHSLVIGSEWEKWDYASKVNYPNFDSDATSFQDNSALFVQDTIQFSERTIVTLGARKQRSRTEIRERDTFAPATTTTATTHPEAYEAILRQFLPAGFDLFLKTGRSFRLATVDENRGKTIPLEPQTSDDNEVALEFRHADADFRIAAYRLDVSNEIHFMFIPGGSSGPFGSNVNLPPTRRQGIELNGGLRITETLQVRARYEHLSARFRRGLFGGVDVGGNEIPLVPEKLASLHLVWQPAARWNLTGTVRHVGEQRFDNDQSNSFSEKMPAYSVVDIKATHALGNWFLSAQVDNLFAREYFSYGIRNPAGDSFNAYPAAERSFFLTAQYRFGG